MRPSHQPVHYACLMSVFPNGFEENSVRGMILNEDLSCALCGRQCDPRSQEWNFAWAIPSMRRIFLKPKGRNPAPTPDYWKEWSEWKRQWR